MIKAYKIVALVGALALTALVGGVRAESYETTDGPAPLAAGIDAVRPGLLAYGDLWHLMFWNDGIHAGQSSSHDESGGNFDMISFHGLYRGGDVLARIEGPGAFYRIWSAAPAGMLFFWKDGESKPVIACSFKKYLAGECGAEPEFHVGRDANYTPIVFKESLVITSIGFYFPAYFQITYNTFDQDPGVAAAESASALADAKKFWASNGREPARDPGGSAATTSRSHTIAAGDAISMGIETGDGSGLVTELRIIDRSSSEPRDALSDLRLRIYWDDDPEPAVDSPVDAFFGNRFDARANGKGGAYDTIAVSASADAYSCRWPMPFAKKIKLAIENTGEHTRSINVEVDVRYLDALPDSAMRFHALYREQDYPDVLSKDKVHGMGYIVPQDTNYVVLEREGRGYYVGCLMYVASLGPEWWGEGDEMVWVDGDPQAVIRGTGTEDEFNWSWGFMENRSPISGALMDHGLPGGTPHATVGYNALYRYRLGDFVPFRDQIKVTYERLGLTSTWIKQYPGSIFNVSQHRGDDYRSVAFWYELPTTP